ncbi:MAG: hypothetical protein CMH50_06025 [Myxococcales bacterium]|nr:hypothetical protein [Myxococcales bacterium]
MSREGGRIRLKTVYSLLFMIGVTAALWGCPMNRVCTEDAHCGPFATCGVDGRCIQGCSRDAHCREGERCDEGRCARPCTVDGECDAGQLCVESRCMPGCSATAPCPAGLSCRDGQCSEGCVTDGDCAPGTFCNQSSACEPFGSRDAGSLQCVGHQDCRVGEYCTDSGQCRVGCRDHSACPLGFYCSESHRCLAGDPPLPSDAGPVQDAGPSLDGGIFALNCGVLGQENVAPRVVVWDEFTLYAEDPGGRPLTRIEWMLEQGAGGDGLRIDQPGDSSTRVQVPRVGAWTFGVTAYRGDGTAGQCIVSMEATPPAEGFFVQLAWEGDRDLDLHMVPVRPGEPCQTDEECEGAGRQCNLNRCSMAFNTQTGTDSDCWARQAQPDWSAGEAPQYTHDIRSGAGTEYIRGRSLELETSYRIAVRTFGNRTNSASLRAWLHGEPMMDQESFRLGPAGDGGWYYVGRLVPAAVGHRWDLVGLRSGEVPRN